MNNLKTKFSLVVIFILSFLIFLYWSFPYGVLKETISTQLQAATGINMRIGHLGPAFPFGFKTEDLEIAGSSGKKIEFQTATIRLNIFSLFLLNLGVNVDLTTKNKGELDADLAFAIPALLKGQLALPSSVDVTAKAFPLDDIVSYGLKQVAASGAGGPAAGPLIAAMGFRGKLNGTVTLSLDSSAPAQSTGKVKLSLNDSALVLSDPSLGFPDQLFKSAQISADLGGGVLKVDPSSRFTAEDLDLGADGRVMLKKTFGSSELDMKMFMKLSGGLSEKFGWVMEGLSGGAAKGDGLHLQIRGTVDAPVTTTL